MTVGNVGKEKTWSSIGRELQVINCNKLSTSPQFNVIWSAPARRQTAGRQQPCDGPSAGQAPRGR